MRKTCLYDLICLLPVILPLTAFEGPAEEYLVYVGTYTGKGSEGIYACRFNPASGELSPVGLAARVENPSFLTANENGQFLYAVNEIDTFQNKPAGGVSAFSVNRETGKLNLLQQVSSLGKGPAHLSLDTSARFLLVANYGSGNFTVLPVGGDGRLGPHTAFVQDVGSSVNPDRQAGPHAHYVQMTKDNRLALVADLGLDSLLVFRLDASVGSLTPARPASYALDPGSGPRHVAVAPSGKFVYVVNELASTVTAFTYEQSAGTLHRNLTISTLPRNFAGKNSTAEIVVGAKGRFLYVSNRGDDSIVLFSIDSENGNLTPVEWVPSGGKTPRNFAIDPTGTWLFAANQGSNEIRLFRIDPANGRLTTTSRSLRVVSPVCVIFVRVHGR